MDLEFITCLIKTKSIESLEKNTILGYNILYFAVLSDDYDLAVLLLKNGFDPRIPSNSGETPLDLAKRLQKPRFIQILIENQGALDTV
jgi:uncharacterized protein